MQKKYRLKDSDLILQTIRSKNCIPTSTFNVFYKKNKLNFPQIAIIASKKKFKLAVTRNKIKRQVRAIVREQLNSINNWNIAIVIKSNWINNTFAINKQNLQKALTKLMKEQVHGK